MEPAGAKPFDQWVAGIRASSSDPTNLLAAQTLTSYVVASNLSALTGRPTGYANPTGVSG